MSGPQGRGRLAGKVAFITGAGCVGPGWGNGRAAAVLFARDARAEVTLSGRVTAGGIARPVFGRVDRLAISGDTVWVADFKTGRPPAAGAPLPRAEAGQIALYAALLAEIYPAHRVVPMLVWTSGPTIRRLSADEIADALETLAQRAA